MKNRLYILCLCIGLLLTTTPVCAQWQASDTHANRLDENHANQSLLRTIRTDEGHIILSWLRYVSADGADVADGGYHLFVQVFNPDGSMRFGQNGLCVSNKRTNTYTTDYSLALAPNGDILLAYCDARDDASMEHIHAYIYRYTLSGEAVWNAEGIRVPVQPINDAYHPDIDQAGTS